MGSLGEGSTQDAAGPACLCSTVPEVSAGRGWGCVRIWSLVSWRCGHSRVSRWRLGVSRASLGAVAGTSVCPLRVAWASWHHAGLGVVGLQTPWPRAPEESVLAGKEDAVLTSVPCLQNHTPLVLPQGVTGPTRHKREELTSMSQWGGECQGFRRACGKGDTELSSLGNPVFSLSGTKISTCKTIRYLSGSFLYTHFVLLCFHILTLLFSPHVGWR